MVWNLAEMKVVVLVLMWVVKMARYLVASMVGKKDDCLVEGLVLSLG